MNVNFKFASNSFRVYSGENALDNLPAEMKRCKAKRAFIVCGRTVSRRAKLISRIRTILGDSYAGVFDEVEKDSTVTSVLGAAHATRNANPDLIIAVGGGSVIQAARVVLILLAETKPLEQLITQFPEHGGAISPKLLERKLPVINVLTLPTAAQNQGGSVLRSDNLDHRMELFDPKTRPVAIFWDTDALMTAPLALTKAAGCTVYWRVVMNLGWLNVNPLLEGTRRQAFLLAGRALSQLDESDSTPRIELCAAGLLLNRDADEGGMVGERHWAARVSYAFAAALLICYPNIRQGEALTAVTGTVIRMLGERDADAMVRLAQNLDAWKTDSPRAVAPSIVADYLDSYFAKLGMPIRLRELGIPSDGLVNVMEHTLKNFNADPNQEFAHEREYLTGVLQSSW